MGDPEKPVVDVLVPVIYKPGQNPGSADIRLRPLELGFMFGKMTDQEMIDAIPLADKYLKGLDKWIKAAKEVAKGRLKQPDTVGSPLIYKGTVFQVVYAKMERTDIDRDKVRAKYGEDGYRELCSTVPYYQMNFGPIKDGPSLPDTPGEDTTG